MKLIRQTTQVDGGWILNVEARKVKSDIDPTRKNVANFLENEVGTLNVDHFNFLKWLSEVTFDDAGELIALKVLNVFLFFSENIFSIDKDSIKSETLLLHFR